MALNEPDEPPGIAQYIVDGLQRQGPDELRTIAAYAKELAAYQEAKAESEMADQEDEVVHETSEDISNLPDDVPAKASVVVKEINNNRYEYYQWREGDKIRSQYKCPVNPDR